MYLWLVALVSMLFVQNISQAQFSVIQPKGQAAPAQPTNHGQPTQSMGSMGVTNIPPELAEQLQKMGLSVDSAQISELLKAQYQASKLLGAARNPDQDPNAGTASEITFGGKEAAKPAQGFSQIGGDSTQQSVIGAEDLPARLAQLQMMLQSPVTRTLLTKLRTPGLYDKLLAIVTHPARSKLFLCEIFLLLCFFIVRAWRLSKIEPDRWIKRFATSAGLFLGYWVTASVVVPAVLFGPVYTEMLALLMRAAT